VTSHSSLPSSLRLLVRHPSPTRRSSDLSAAGLSAIRSRRSTTSVLIGSPSPEELEAYIATVEPFQVAGALTIDGYGGAFVDRLRSEEHTSELQSRFDLVCRRLLAKKQCR